MHYLIIPFVINFIAFFIGFFYIKRKAKTYAIDKTPWYILLVFMPIIALLVFYFTQVKPKAN